MCAHVTLCIRVKVVYLQRHIQGLELMGSSQMLNKDGGQRAAHAGECAMSAPINGSTLETKPHQVVTTSHVQEQTLIFKK